MAFILYTCALLLIVSFGIVARVRAERAERSRAPRSSGNAIEERAVDTPTGYRQPLTLISRSPVL